MLIFIKMKWKEIFQRLNEGEIMIKDNIFSEAIELHDQKIEELEGNYKGKYLASLVEGIESSDEEMECKDINRIRKKLLRLGVKNLPSISYNFESKKHKFYYSFPLIMKIQHVVGEKEYIEEIKGPTTIVGEI